LDISVHETTSTPDALTAFRAHRPDLVLLDLNLPNSSSLKLLIQRSSALGWRAQRHLTAVEFVLYSRRVLLVITQGFTSRSRHRPASSQRVSAIRRNNKMVDASWQRTHNVLTATSPG
jgi:CheY-like chemotaxis protein